jgi:hypothetical protein
MHLGKAIQRQPWALLHWLMSRGVHAEVGVHDAGLLTHAPFWQVMWTGQPLASRYAQVLDEQHSSQGVPSTGSVSGQLGSHPTLTWLTSHSP